MLGNPDDDTDLLSVMSLHALVYCERLFYLEEVEKIRVADARVYGSSLKFCVTEKMQLQMLGS